MIIVKLWHYIRGYVIINIKGNHLERLINLIQHNHILIWDIVRIDSDEMTAKVEIEDYNVIIELSKPLSCEVNMVRKSGMTLWKWRAKNRRIFVIASIFVLLGLYLMSLFVLTVDVVGDFTVAESEIVEDLAERGLKPWRLKGSVDISGIKSSFLNDHKNVEYIDIEFSGTKAIVNVVEEETVEKIYDKSTPVDLIAKKDAIIRELLVVNGTANVKVDQEVKKGDLLVKGETLTASQSEEGEEEIFKKSIHAKAKIMGQVNYSEKFKLRKYKVIDEESYKINRVLHIGDLVINFLDSDENYYYHSSEEENFNLFNFKLPVKMDKIKYYDKGNCVNKTKEELEEEVREKAREKFREIGQVEKIEFISVQEENNSNEYDVNVTVIEEISEEQLLNE